MRTIDLQQFTDDARLNRFHWAVLFWCALMIIFDGYDLAVVGVALPSIMADMHVAPTRAGMMVSSALFGMMFGNLLFGSLAGKIGRRRTIAICLAFFSVLTAASGFTHEALTFGICRFIAGLGMGGVMPGVVAQMTEYAPRRVRSTMVTLMFSGYSIGGAAAALLGKAIIESHGWPSVFIAAGLPILLIPCVLKWLPDSMPYLLQSGNVERLRDVLGKIDPSHVPRADDRYATDDGATGEHRATFSQLFTHGRALSTVMFWIACFMCLFMVYALSSWLVKLMAGSGYSLGSALSFMLVLNIGALVGAIGGGWLADHFHIKYVLVGMYVTAAVSIALLGFQLPEAALLFVVGVAGAATIGNQIVTIAYAGQFYPMTVRATGVGIALGVGRLGAITAPVFIGALVGIALPLRQDFFAIAIPACVAALAISLINHSRSAASRAAVPDAQAGAMTPQPGRAH
ncbi:MFS transporter [Paraburkholderia gardini]|uniref:4-hydroxybenzoate transporter PcaK n=1 Tax=Paraburkholderia gardini TaxID=2823469 RepID=A0ABN7QMJ5_9BURK|nr:MFS transporter [Paraburkholderia gardini]CAG4909496.1 4-hydroxybenzoate transporter PcaK [Paraburkholderia gardini]